MTFELIMHFWCPFWFRILRTTQFHKERQETWYFGPYQQLKLYGSQTDTQTDMATLWPTWPRGPSQWKLLNRLRTYCNVKWRDETEFILPSVAVTMGLFCYQQTRLVLNFFYAIRFQPWTSVPPITSQTDIIIMFFFSLLQSINLYRS